MTNDNAATTEITLNFSVMATIKILEEFYLFFHANPLMSIHYLSAMYINTTSYITTSCMSHLKFCVITSLTRLKKMSN